MTIVRLKNKNLPSLLIFRMKGQKNLFNVIKTFC